MDSLSLPSKVLPSKHISWIQIFVLGLSLTSCDKKSVEEVYPESQKAVAQEQEMCAGESIKGQYIVQWTDGHFSKIFADSETKLIEQFIKPNLENLRLVESDRMIHLEYPIKNLRVVEVNSPDPDQWYLKTISAPEAWNQNAKGENILVGVVDTFVDYKNFQLHDRIALNNQEIPENGIDDDNNGVIDDYYFGKFTKGPLTDPNDDGSHGTHIAGVIAADPTMGEISGIAPKSKIISSTFLDATGAGSLSDAILALNYAVSRGARVINASWGGPQCVKSLYNAFVEIQNKDILLLTAAGNGNPYTGLGEDLDFHPIYPAIFNLANQITVAASDNWDFMTSFSNMSWNLVHLAAPGEDIKSTVLKNKYEYLSGTSMATPMVAGAAAAIWSAYPQARALEVKEALLSSVDIVPNHEMKVVTKGRLNVAKALQALKNKMEK